MTSVRTISYKLVRDPEKIGWYDMIIPRTEPLNIYQSPALKWKSCSIGMIRRQHWLTVVFSFFCVWRVCVSWVCVCREYVCVYFFFLFSCVIYIVFLSVLFFCIFFFFFNVWFSFTIDLVFSFCVFHVRPYIYYLHFFFFLSWYSLFFLFFFCVRHREWRRSLRGAPRRNFPTTSFPGRGTSRTRSPSRAHPPGP